MVGWAVAGLEKAHTYYIFLFIQHFTISRVLSKVTFSSHLHHKQCKQILDVQHRHEEPEAQRNQVIDLKLICH